MDVCEAFLATDNWWRHTPFNTICSIFLFNCKIDWLMIDCLLFCENRDFVRSSLNVNKFYNVPHLRNGLHFICLIMCFLVLKWQTHILIFTDWIECLCPFMAQSLHAKDLRLKLSVMVAAVIMTQQPPSLQAFSTCPSFIELLINVPSLLQFLSRCR